MRSVHDIEDFQCILKQHQLVLANFTANWCGPCKRFKPALEEYQKQFLNVFFCTINVDDCTELTKNYNITSMPTFLFFKDGELLQDKTVVGAKQENVLHSLEKICKL